MPAPQWPYELTLQALRGFYDDVSHKLLEFVSGLAVYDRLGQTRRLTPDAVPEGRAPRRAHRAGRDEAGGRDEHEP